MTDLFEEMMGNVRPIKKKKRIEPPLPRPMTVQHRTSTPPTPATPQTQIKRQEPWVLKAQQGLSNKQLKRLRSGKMPVDTEIDLHGMRQDESISALKRFIENAKLSDARVLSIIHGRGLHSQGGQPILKEAVYHWLQNGLYANDILATVPSPGSSGGACLLLLRN
ncbi:MAG: Smr/MutS family protein [Mariprofundaceae bacterium]